MSSKISEARAAITQAADDIRTYHRAADTAAARLAAGGRLFIAGQPGMVSELTGRAGGLMMARPLGDAVSEAGDAVLYFGGRSAAPLEQATRATCIAFGGQTDLEAEFAFPAIQAPLPDLYTNAIAGWLFTGELIAALIRLGKMPVLYESIGAYSGHARIQQYDNGAVAFHIDMPVPAPLMPGELGRRYAERIGEMLARVEEEESDHLARVGAWCAEARSAGRRCYMYSMGHLFPALVVDSELGDVFTSGVWNAGFRGEKPADQYNAGDVVVHIGYQHPPSSLLQRARSAGARAAYVAVRAHRDYFEEDDVVWIDPMWEWADACVPIEGYDVPALAASGLLNGAIALDIHRRMME